MKVSELVKFLEHSKVNRYDQAAYDEEVSIALADPSIGARSMSAIESAYYGFDWESGHLILIPKQKLTRKKYKEAVLDTAYDFIYGLSKEVTYKGNPTSLAKHAQAILDRAKEKLEENE